MKVIIWAFITGSVAFFISMTIGAIAHVTIGYPFDTAVTAAFGTFVGCFAYGVVDGIVSRQ
jgi:uncharacterized membrane protein YccC